MAKFIDAYCLDGKDFWGVTCADVATSTGESVQRVQWLIKKMKRELKSSPRFVYKIKGDSCHRPDDIYGLSPDFVVGLCGHIGNWRAFKYGAFMMAFECRIEFHRKILNRQISYDSSTETLENYLKFIKTAVKSGKTLSVKNELLRLLYRKYDEIRLVIEKKSA